MRKLMKNMYWKVNPPCLGIYLLNLAVDDLLMNLEILSSKKFN